jgi:tetratricopeptide (TPR) repeat protein
VFFYLLEYFPSHLGMRLEVNHPLYALAWAGGGEIIFRVCRWWGGGKLAEAPRDWAWLAGSAVAVALVPVLIFFFADQVFTVADPFLWMMHNDYIEEFFSLFVFLKSQSFWMWIIMANPLVLLAAPMVFWSCQRSWPRPARALLLLALMPALITFGQAVVQVRWIETCYALWLAALVAVAMALRLHHAYRWNPLRLAAVSLFLVWALLPNPAYTIFTWVQGNWKGAVSQVEPLELLTRDVAQRLRARQGDSPIVVVSGPTSSTWLTYWGGFQSLGTYYWENLAGMKANAEIYGASTPEQALKLLQAHHATDLVILSWVDSPTEYAHLSHNLRKDQPVPENAFAWGLTHGRFYPSWLRPIYYPLPQDNDYYKHLSVLIFEIDPGQSAAVSLARLAQWQMELGDNNAAIVALNDSLQADPAGLPALITAARLDSIMGKSDLFALCVQRLRELLPQADSLDFDDRVELAIVFAIAKQDDLAREEAAACVRTATLPGLRILRPEALFNFLSIARQTHVLDQRPALFSAANPLLPAAARAQLFVQFADLDKADRQLPDAIALLHHALVLDPDSIFALNRLSWILSTSTDDSVRNGAEALTLALHSREIDHGKHVNITDALACAYAESGDYAQATQLELQAIDQAEQAHAEDVAVALRTRLVLFQQNKPYRE